MRGDLAIHDQKILIITGAHADDSPASPCGKVESAERIRKQYPRQYNDPEVR